MIAGHGTVTLGAGSAMPKSNSGLWPSLLLLEVREDHDRHYPDKGADLNRISPPAFSDRSIDSLSEVQECIGGSVFVNDDVLGSLKHAEVGVSDLGGYDGNNQLTCPLAVPDLLMYVRRGVCSFRQQHQHDIASIDFLGDLGVDILAGPTVVLGQVHADVGSGQLTSNLIDKASVVGRMTEEESHSDVVPHNSEVD